LTKNGRTRSQNWHDAQAQVIDGTKVQLNSSHSELVGVVNAAAAAALVELETLFFQALPKKEQERLAEIERNQRQQAA
jgi:hypothetical protein